MRFPKEKGKICEGCEYEHHNLVRGEGPRDAKVVLVGEAPGLEEDLSGRPFVGKAGKLLKRILREQGFTKEDVYISNVVKCRPPENKLDDKVIPRCMKYFSQEIQKLNPNVVVLLGAKPLKAFTRRVGITAMRGRVMHMTDFNTETILGIPKNSEYVDFKLIPCLHPALILRQQNNLPTLIKDIRLVKEESRTKDILERKFPTRVIVLNSLKKIKLGLKKIRHADIVACDIETTGLNFTRDEILCISFSVEEGTSMVLPLTHGENADPIFKRSVQVKITELLVKTIQRLKNKIIFHNGKFDLKFLGRCGVKLSNYGFQDTMCMFHLLDENSYKNLKFLADTFTSMGNYDSEMLEVIKKYKAQHNYGKVPDDILWKYCGADSDATLRLFHIFKTKLEEKGLWNYYLEFSYQSNKTLLWAEYRGIKILRKRFERVGSRLSEKIAKVEGRMFQIAEQEFNPRSTKQVNKIFYEEQGMPVVKYTNQAETTPSTDEETLLELIDGGYRLAQLLLNHRKESKLYRTYIGESDDKGFRKHLDSKNRIHASFNICGTVTGRLSSSEPNMQNIPRGKEKGSIKTLFGVRKGWYMISADYSQIEIKIAALEANDGKMLRAFQDGMDIHAMTADALEIERRAAKSFIFGLLYGAGAKGLARSLDMSVKRIYPMIDKFNEQWVELGSWMRRIPEITKERGRLKNVFGRIRTYPKVDTDWEIAAQGRQGVNYIPQSSAACICQRAANNIAFRIRKHKLKSFLINTVHDSLMYEVPEQELYAMKKIICVKMLKPIPEYNNYVFSVGIGVGADWAESENNEIEIKSGGMQGKVLGIVEYLKKSRKGDFNGNH